MNELGKIGRIVLCIGAVVSACSSSGTTRDTACSDNAVRECRCANGDTGTQSCLDGGPAWQPCDCSGAGVGGSGGETPGAAGSAIDLGGAPGTGGATVCTAGDTRGCVGPGACDGGQVCLSDGTWGDCDCGTTGTGGADGSGGSGTGGATVGSGGASSAGAPPTGSGGATPGEVIQSWTFDADLEGWNVTWTEPQDDTALAEGTAVGWNAEAGDPEPGAISLTAPFTGSLNKAQVGLPLASTVNLDGCVVMARVRLESGLSTVASSPGGAKVYVKDSAYVWAGGPWTNLSEGDWVNVTLFVDLPDYEDAGFDPTAVLEVGVEIGTGDSTADVWTAAVVSIDTIEFVC